MTQLMGGSFDATQVDPTQSAGQLPVGKHPVVITASEIKANKNNDGGYAEFTLKIIDGPQTGTTGAYRLNLYHNNQTTVEIAQRQLSALCHVTGVFRLDDTTQLHNIPFIVEVGVQKNDEKYTEVKRVFDANGNEPGKANAGGQGGAAQPQQQTQQQQNNGGGWGGQQAQNNGNAPANNGGQGGGWNGGGQGNQGGQDNPQQGNQGGAAWGNGNQNGNGNAAQNNGGGQGGNAGGGWQQNNGGQGGNGNGNAPWN